MIQDAMTSRKPLFSRPTWASQRKTTNLDTTQEDEEPAFGRHGQRIYNDILKIERKERAEKEKRTERKATSIDRDVHASKKRRISEENDSTNNSDSSANFKPSRRIKTPDSTDHKPTTRSTPTKNRLPTGLDELPIKRNSPRNASKTTTITIGDDGKEDSIIVTKSASHTSPSNPKLQASPVKSKTNDDGLTDSDDDDDPRLRELRAKAREKQRLQRLGLQTVNPIPSSTSVIDVKSPTPFSDQAPDTEPPKPSTDSTSSKPTPAISPPDDPEVQIYIKPLIPNTKALIVNRRASQNLEPVKSYWCQRQGLTDAEAANIFFTWRDIKLFNSSTMRHIVDRLNRERKPGQDHSDGKVVIEAVTQDIFDYQQAEKLQRAAAKIAEENGTLKEEVMSPLPEPEKGNRLVIKLQSKEYGELSIRIRLESTVCQIARGYIHRTAPDTTKTPYLIFDGDRLEGERTAQDIGLEDGDVVEVQFR